MGIDVSGFSSTSALIFNFKKGMWTLELGLSFGVSKFPMTKKSKNDIKIDFESNFNMSLV